MKNTKRHHHWMFCLLLCGLQCTNQPQSDDIQVFPNPFTDNLMFRLAAPIQEATTISLFDLNGRQLKYQQVPIGTSRQISIPTDDLVAGTYIARWSNSSTTQTVKVLKMN
jgi:hypothetical protein